MIICKKQKAMDALNNLLKNCSACRLSSSRKHVLAGEGDLDARLMFVALSPGSNEDLKNRMFIGPSGKKLDILLGYAEIYRELVFMTNLIKCMLPKNRRPKIDEIESCCHFLDKEISIINPRIIVPLGYYATRHIMKKYNANPPAARANFKSIYGRLIFSDHQKIFPLPHPASLLYNPSFETNIKKKYKKLAALQQEGGGNI